MLPERDVGLGTAYERLAVAGWLVRRAGRPKTALEGPVDAMAGIPGLHLLPLARRGTRVTVVLPSRRAIAIVREVYARAGLVERLDARVDDRLPEGPHDLVFAFNALPVVPDWRAYLARAAAAGERLAVIVSNRDSYGALIRRGLRAARGAPTGDALFDHESTDPATLEPELRRHGRVIARDFVDCPWWPDLFVEPGQTLVGGTLGRLRPVRPATPGPFDYDAATFPWAHGCPPELRRALRRHPVADGRAQALGRALGHHRAYLIDRSRSVG